MKNPVVILVNPQMAENVGMSARAMMNCGLYEMRIVSPREDHLSDKAVAASSGADKILREARLYDTTQEAVADLGLVYATTARRRNMIKIVETAEGAAREINLKSQAGIKCGILFGPERTGLHNDDVALADKIIEIPLNPEHCSLNLSQAVLLAGYEIYKHHVDVPDVQLITNGGEIADKEKINRFFAFLDINPLVKGHTLVVPKQEVDYIFDLSDEDLAAMHVFAKKIARAIEKAFPCKKVGEAVIGLEVPHAHIHLIPIQKESDMLFSNPKLKLSDEEFKSIAQAISSSL